MLAFSKKIVAIALLGFCFGILIIPSTFAVEPEISAEQAKLLEAKNACSNSYDVKAVENGTTPIAYDLNNCGKPNAVTNVIELGDCSAAGNTVVELIEPIGPEVKLSENEYILDVYKGVCCLHYNSESNPTACTETRSVYGSDYDECDSVAAFCEKRQWIIGSSGIGLVKVFVKQVYIYGAGIVGFIAVVVIVISGIQISVSGVSGDITAAKDRIVQSISGLVLLFLSGLILYTINPTFFS